MILKRKAIDYLNKELSLPFTGVEQDWEIEMADSSRLEEFIIFYEKSHLNIEEKRALMSLIIASYDDMLNECENKSLWNRIAVCIVSEKQIFSDILSYWKLDNEEIEENLFNITPLIRGIENKESN